MVLFKYKPTMTIIWVSFWPWSLFLSLFFPRTIQSEVEQKKKEDEVKYVSSLKQKIADFGVEAQQDMDKENSAANARFQGVKPRGSGKKKRKSKSRSSDSSGGSDDSNDDASGGNREDDNDDDDDDRPPKKNAGRRGKRPRDSKTKPAKNAPKEHCLKLVSVGWVVDWNRSGLETIFMMLCQHQKYVKLSISCVWPSFGGKKPRGKLLLGNTFTQQQIKIPTMR